MIYSAALRLLNQLKSVILSLDDTSFTTPILLLNHATIGQHTRHSLEFFIALKESHKSKTINYDNRKRDIVIEQNINNTIDTINEIIEFLEQKPENYDLIYSADYSIDGYQMINIDSSFLRELAYNVEHLVHHMALIRTAIHVLSPEKKLPKDFGVAASTIRNKSRV